VCSSSHDDSLNEGDITFVGKEHNTVKLKHIISLDRENEKSHDSLSPTHSRLH
jgi:hypothetical protein